ncbi:sensor histidine kinase [Tenacibaculum sp. SG-28]|uniref:sensor histidine kinase n=1 Tax=Tenacibaculum sp. SG-28 TaxID=754426 RepID=UPI000CF4E8E9|nr:histidine kinase [Tenacibaculum sp. SG-28]PQJ23267.1 histidine kinase [Tenacibaculum sp. SG-28]
MPIFDKKKRLQYLGFDDFWFSVLGIILLSTITNYLFNAPEKRASITLVFIGWFAAFSNTMCYWLGTRLILIELRKKYPDFKDDVIRIFLLLLCIVVVTPVIDMVMGNFLAWVFRLFGYTSSYNFILKIIIPVFLIVVMMMAIYEAMYFYARLKKSIREEEQLKRVMVQAQLDTLRNQARPHFLFNSLNTLRDIIDQEDKEEAKVFVDKLSDVYRFILESGSSNLIPLEKEIQFVRSYVHIQLERFGTNLIIQWEISQDILQYQIVPMSLQLLVENAIKHNVVSKAKPLVVVIKTGNKTLFVGNRIQAKSTKTPSTKIGLKNIKERYALITREPVTISTKDSYFSVELPLLKTMT